MTLKLFVGIFAGAAIGGVIGYLSRCAGGTCPLTCNPIGGIIIGAMMGVMISSSSTKTPVDRQTSQEEHEINSVEQFDKALKAEGIVLVDFFAEWCGPCRMLQPSINQIANDYSGRLKVLSVNVDRFADIAQRYNIYSIPDVRIFRNGKEIERITGLRPAKFYSTILDNLLTGQKTRTD